MALPYPVIVVPGITATYLQDEYPIPPVDIWKVVKKQYERIMLHPNDLRYDALEPARVRPGQLYEIAYEELIEELRYNLSPREDQPVPVYPFGYDWRMPLEITEIQLAAFVDEVIERTKLLRHYHKEKYNDNPRVNLIGHSMGGLIIAGYLEREGGRAPVDKVVTLATPFQGSFEAVIKVATGTADLGTTPPGSREREASRITPALYHLIPSFANGIDAEVTDQILPGTLFNPGLWQPGVIESLAEFIRKKGLPSEKTKKEQAEDLFAFLLAQAKKHRDRIDEFKLSMAKMTDKNWLAIVGVDAPTRVRLRIVKRGNQPDFVLTGKDRKNEWANEDPQKRRLTGDGTVPFEGAVPKFLEERNLVLVTPEDYGYWEIQNRALVKVAGFHGLLPSMNMLHRMIVRFFKDQPDKRKNT